MSKTPLDLTRKQLAAFVPDQRTLKALEELVSQVNVSLPADITFLTNRVQEVLIDAWIASATANEALDGLEYLRLAEELLALAPQPEPNFAPNFDVAPPAEPFIAPNFDVTPVAPRDENVFQIDYLDFNPSAPHVDKTRRLVWNDADDTLNLHHSDGVTQQVGQELYGRITNNTGSLIPNGSVLGINPATNSYVLFIANGTRTPITIIGVTTQDIPNGAAGRVTVWGQVHDLDTTGTPFGEVWNAGDILYVSPTIAGGFTKVKPTAPNLSMPIAQVRIVSATVGSMAIRPTIEQQLFYGSFIKTTDQTPAAINTAYALTWDAATISNGVSIGVPSSRIVCANAGLYKFSASFQLTSSSASVKNVWLWFRKNGVDVANSAMITSLDSSSAVRTPSRSLFFSMQAGDYMELMFASDSTAMTVDNIASTAFAPATPAAILTVNQEQQ